MLNLPCINTVYLLLWSYFPCLYPLTFVIILNYTLPPSHTYIHSGPTVIALLFIIGQHHGHPQTDTRGAASDQHHFLSGTRHDALLPLCSALLSTLRHQQTSSSVG